MKQDEVVEAIVERAEVYGVYLRHQGEQILVLIPEVSWLRCPGGDCRQFTSPGKAHLVKILRYVEEKELFVGSIKRAVPERDPWFDPHRFDVGTKWNGFVRHYIWHEKNVELFGYVVEIIEGVDGLLKPTSASVLPIGTLISVCVRSVRPEQREIELEVVAD